jgi:uncharacterized protein (TIGR02996 family)
MTRPARPEVLALLADVKENPDDLTPWLVLTDWLDEHGDEADRARAEYCRLCFDKLGKKTYASDWEKGERRRELFRTYRERWFGDLSVWFTPAHPGGPLCQIQRGLVQVSAQGGDLLAVVGAGWPGELGSWVERLVVSNYVNLNAEQLMELARSPLLVGPAAVELHLYSDLERQREALLALAESPYLNGVRDLCLSFGAPLADKDAVVPLRKRFGKAFRMRQP